MIANYICIAIDFWTRRGTEHGLSTKDDERETCAVESIQVQKQISANLRIVAANARSTKLDPCNWLRLAHSLQHLVHEYVVAYASRDPYSTGPYDLVILGHLQ